MNIQNPLRIEAVVGPVNKCKTHFVECMRELFHMVHLSQIHRIRKQALNVYNSFFQKCYFLTGNNLWLRHTAEDTTKSMDLLCCSTFGMSDKRNRFGKTSSHGGLSQTRCIILTYDSYFKSLLLILKTAPS